MAFNMSPTQQLDPLSNGITGGVSDIFDRAMGPQLRPGAANPYEAKSYNRINMLAEYEKATPIIRQTIDDYTLTSEYDWLSRYVLPILYTEEIDFAWTSWSTTNTYMGPTPHMSNSNVITMKRQIRKASIIRRGIAYEFEDDYIRTVGGRASVYAAIGCIARSLREVINMEGLRALRSCHIHEVEFAREYNLYTMDDLDGHLDRFCERFMIVQKTEFGIEKLNELVDADQERIQGKANAWIFGREIAAYCQVVDPNKTLFYLGGQEAVDRVNGRQVGPAAAANTMGNIRSVAPTFSIKGTPVFIAKSYYVDNIKQADLLTRTVEIGVYNMMVDRTLDYSEYSPAIRNLKIYNNDRDDWHIEMFDNALANLPIWNTNGELEDHFTGNQRVNKEILSDKSDFLSMPVGNGRRNIRFIGDMNQTWLSAQDCIEGGQTLLNVLSYRDPNTARQMIMDYAGNVGNKADLQSRLREIVGDDSVFTRPAVTDAIFEADLFTTRAGGATALNIANQVDAGTETEAKTQKWLNEVVAFPVPAEFKGEASRIITQSDKHWKERADLIKGIINDTIRNNANPSFQNTQEADVWYSKRITSFTKDMETTRSASSASTQQRARVAGAAGMESLRLLGANVDLNPGARGSALIETNNRTNNTPDQNANLIHNLNEIDQTSVPRLLKVLAKVYAGIKFSRQRLRYIHAAGVAVKLHIMLARAHCAYKSRYGMKVATGGLVGFTAMGHSSMDIGHDAGKKGGFMHYTTMIGPVVTDPRHVAVVSDIYIQKYIGGMGVEYWTPQRYKLEQARRTASIIAIPLPPQVKKMEKRIDLRGRWFTMHKLGFVTEDRYNREMYPGAARIRALFGLDPATTNAQSRNSSVNFVLYQGMEWYFNPKQGVWSDFTIEQSPFGPKVHPGCGEARNGNLKFLETPPYLKGY